MSNEYTFSDESSKSATPWIANIRPLVRMNVMCAWQCIVRYAAMRLCIVCDVVWGHRNCLNERIKFYAREICDFRHFVNLQINIKLKCRKMASSDSVGEKRPGSTLATVDVAVPQWKLELIQKKKKMLGNMKDERRSGTVGPTSYGESLEFAF